MSGWKGLMVCLCLTVASGQDLTEVDNQKWEQYYNENQKLLVVFYQTDDCASCQEVIEKIANIVDQPEVPADMAVGKTADSILATKLGVTSFPTVAFLRDKTHVFYDGDFDVEDVIEWVQMALSTATRQLNDDSFEHLTQASTGATTGNWLVAFYSEPCKDVLSSIETLGVRFRGRINMAKVNVADSKVLTQRFNISKCPQVILFKLGKMYRYNLPKLDIPMLRSFVDGFYKNAKAENVPGQKSRFDHLTEKIADVMKAQLDGENRYLVLGGVVTVAAVMLAVLLCCCRPLVGAEVKQKAE